MVRDAARALQRIRTIPPTASRAGGSFRDPEGHVFVASGRVFRGVARRAEDRLRALVRSDFFRKRAGASIVETWEVAPEEVVEAGVPAADVGVWAMWAEHKALPLVTYPYEWPFGYLKQAACLTLDLLADALRNGYTLKDASAFNVQFIDSRPIFIDVLSFVEYEEGAPFLGYKQFCEQFFAPLCLTAFAGIDFNEWFRGRLDGLDLIDTSRALPLSTRCRPQVLMHLHSQAWAMQKLKSASPGARSGRNRRRIPRRNLIALADGLRRYMGGLERKRRTYWQKYASHNSYDDRSRASKTRIAQEFVTRTGPARLLDLGCNTGEYSKAAIDAGACSVIGVDSDCGALDLAAGRARRDSWPAQFLFWDIANPSPDLGWMREERSALERRLGRMDAVFCFALIHHLVIGRNIPLEEFVRWVCGLAPRGLIEFVPKSDPMTQGLLRDREDIFERYDRENFERALEEYAATVKVHDLAPTARTMFEFQR